MLEGVPVYDTLPRLPTPVTAFEVRCRIGQFVMDHDDPDRAPDLVAIGGTVTIVPNLTKPLRVIGEDPLDTRVVGVNTLVFEIDPESGQLRHPDGTLGVELIDPNNPLLEPYAWTYTATVNPAVGPAWTVTFGGPAGGTGIVNLGALAGVDISPGQSANAVQQVVAARDETVQYVQVAEASAVQAVTAAAEASSSATYAAEVAYGQPLEVTDAVVTDLATDSAATFGQILEARYRRSVSLAEFGAVGDGVADDTAAVLAALTDGRPLHWGSGTYRITDPIEVTATRPVVWTADGAKVIADFATVPTYMIRIDANGHDVDIRGTLTIDAAKQAHTCIYLLTRFSRASFMAEDLRATRAYRSVPELIGGDGIAIGGGWDRVHLNRCRATDIGMAAGAALSGARGVSGIYVHEISKTGGADVPYDVQITDPIIDDIYSDDPAWKVDQDGIRVFGAPETTGDTLIRTTCMVRAGEIRNALGRAMKFQTPNASVDGTKIVRTKGGQGATYDIDFQVGGGSVSNIECTYVDAAPVAVIQCSGERGNEVVPQVVISNVKVALRGTAALSRVVSVGALGELVKSITVRDVTVKGGTPQNLVLLAGISGGRMHLTLAGAVAAVTDAFVVAQGGSPSGWDLDLTATSCINTAAVPALLSRSASSLARISAVSSALVRLI